MRLTRQTHVDHIRADAGPMASVADRGDELTVAGPAEPMYRWPRDILTFDGDAAAVQAMDDRLRAVTW